jgi:hypothetical protein
LAFHSGREADHSPQSSAEVGEWVELYLHSPSTPSGRGAHLVGAQGQLYIFTFIVCLYVWHCTSAPVVLKHPKLSERRNSSVSCYGLAFRILLVTGFTY